MDNSIYLITLSAPGKNSLSRELMRWLIAELGTAAGRPVLLTGAGDAFSAGLNLKEVVGLDADGMRDFLEVLETLVDTLYGYPGPTVAWINGHAIAGGCLLALCCDHRIATSDPRLRIGLNEVAIGLRFPPRTLAMVRQRLTAPALERVLLEAALHGPEQALALGLCDELAAPEVAEATALTHLARLASHPPDAYRAAKQALRGGALAVAPQEAQRFREEVVPIWCSPELKQRIAAVLKPPRPPQ